MKITIELLETWKKDVEEHNRIRASCGFYNIPLENIRLRILIKELQKCMMKED